MSDEPPDLPDITLLIMQPFFIIGEPIKEATLSLEAVHRDPLCLLELSPTELQKGQD